VADRDIPFGNTDYQRAYERFLRAALEGDRETALGLVDADEFGAYIPGRFRLSFDEFMRYMHDLRVLAPDFGSRMTYLNFMEHDGLLAMLYRAFYRIAMTGQEICYVSSDWATFNTTGKIIELRVLYDRADNQEQVFGKPVTPMNPND